MHGTDPGPKHAASVSPPHFPFQPQLSQSHRGILLSVGSGPRDTEPSFHRAFTNTPGPERTSLWQGGTMETGTDHRAQFLGIPVPGITPGVPQSPEEQRGQRCWRSRVWCVFFMGPSDWFEGNSAAILVRCTGWMLTSLWGCSRVHSFGKKI